MPATISVTINETLARLTRPARSSACLFFALLQLALVAPAQAQTIYVRAGSLVDVERGVVLSDQLIRIEGERIAAVAPYAPPPAGSVVLDWSRYQLLPGLIDMHTHLADYGQSSNPAEPLLHSPQETVLKGVSNARSTLRAGFTTVHDVGCFRAFSDVALRDAINAGVVEGPRMSVVGAYITTPGGGGEVTGLAPDILLPADMRVGVVRDENDTRLKVRALFQRGVDGIKLIATGAVLALGTEPGRQELTEGEMRAAVVEAQGNGGFVVAHAHGAAGIKAAIRAGVRVIEHASLIDDEGIALAKRMGTALDMDIYNGDYIEAVGTRDGWPADYLRKNRETTDAQREAFRKAVKAGVTLAFGTDEGVYPYGDNARQFAYMVRYGMTPLQAIQAATTTAARLLGWSRDVGAASPGHYADLIAVEGDALKDVAVLTRVVAVMKGGHIVKAP